MHHFLGLKFPLPKPAAPVHQRELTVVTNGTPRVVLLPGAATISEEFIFAEEDSYSVTLVDIDEHGHRSLPSVPLHGSIIDDVRPAQPGELGPLVDANKHHMNEEEAAKAKEELAKKNAADAKVAQAKAQEKAAKAEQDAKDEAVKKAKAEAEASKK